MLTNLALCANGCGEAGDGNNVGAPCLVGQMVVVSVVGHQEVKEAVAYGGGDVVGRVCVCVCVCVCG